MVECVWPGCSRELEPHLFLCAEHWKSTPFEVKRGMRGSWQNGAELEGQPIAFKRAYIAFELWIQKEFAGDQDRHDPGRWARLRQFVKDRDAKRRERESAKEKSDVET